MPNNTDPAREAAFELAALEYRNELGLVVLTSEVNRAHREGFYAGYDAGAASVDRVEIVSDRCGQLLSYANSIEIVMASPSNRYTFQNWGGTWAVYEGNPSHNKLLKTGDLMELYAWVYDTVPKYSYTGKHETTKPVAAMEKGK